MKEVAGVQYQSDYVLRLIEQMGGLIRRAMERFRVGSDEEPYEMAGQALSLALEMDPRTIERLAPQSLVALLEMTSLDDRVIVMVAEAIELQAEVLERQGELVGAGVRRQQAEAVRTLLDPARAN